MQPELVAADDERVARDGVVGYDHVLCSVKRPSEAVLWLAKLTQCLSCSAWLDHDSSSSAGGRIIIACAFSGYRALQMEQCVDCGRPLGLDPALQAVEVHVLHRADALARPMSGLSSVPDS